MIASMPSLVAADFVAAKVSYGAIAPMLIVFGAALIGVLVEAFAPRRGALRHPGGPDACSPSWRHWPRSSWSAATTRAAPWRVPWSSTARRCSCRAPCWCCPSWASSPWPSASTASGPDAFTPQGAAVPGSPQESLALRAGAATTEVFPLTLFAVVGMMLFPAAGDLLVMFVALEVLSLPLYILSGLARRRRLLSQEASLKYFLLGAFSSAFFLFGAALLYGYAGSMSFGDDLGGDHHAVRHGRPAAAGRAAGLGRPAVQGRRRAVPLLDPGRLPGRAHPGHRLHGRLHQGRRVRGDAAADLRRRRRQPLGLGAGAVGRGDPDHGRRLGAHRSPRPTSSACWPTPRSRTPGFVLVGVLAFDRVGVSAVLFYLAAYGFSIIAAFAVVSLVRDGGSEATHLSQWAGLGKRNPVVAGILAFLLLAFAGIPLTSGFTAKYAVFAAAVAHGGAGPGGRRRARQHHRRVRLRPRSSCSCTSPSRPATPRTW